MKKMSLALLVTGLALGTVACNPSVHETSVSNTSTGIIGGTEVVEGSSLHQSIVGIYDMKAGALCTGSLIADNLVLTAAHCIGKNASDHLIVFATDMLGTFDEKKTDRATLLAKVRRGDKTIVNEQWGLEHKGAEAWGDIALIRFQGKAPAGFKPATFLASSNALVGGTKVVVAGYGVSDNKLIPVDPNTTPDFKKDLEEGTIFCDDSGSNTNEKCYREDTSGSGILRTTELVVKGRLNKTEVVLDQSRGQASCQGDSGGPAYVQAANGAYQLWGVTSRGTRGCNALVLYTDAVAQMSWVQSKASEILK